MARLKRTMKVRTVACIASLAASTVSCGAAAAEHDNLPVLDSLRALGSAERGEDLATSRLVPTRFDCGRLVLSQKESVSVYSRGRGSYLVTYVTAVEDLLDVPLRKQRAIRITRSDAEIPEQTALALRRLWLAMLSRPYAPAATEQNTPVVIDGLSAEFSISTADSAVIRGGMPFGQRYWGPHLKRFWKVAMSLFAYSKSKPAQREHLAVKLEREAEATAAALGENRMME